MREIKFRAWDTETKEMSYDFLSKNWLKVCVESPYVELMQYTGMKDRNRKDVYEGDVVKFTYNSDPQEEHIGIVEWDNRNLAWTFAGLLIENTPRKTMEVLGNRFTYLHLLPKEEEQA